MFQVFVGHKTLSEAWNIIMNLLIKSSETPKRLRWKHDHVCHKCNSSNWHAFSSGSLHHSLQEHGSTVGDGNGVWCWIASELHKIGAFPGGDGNSKRLRGNVKVTCFRLFLGNSAITCKTGIENVFYYETNSLLYFALWNYPSALAHFNICKSNT